MSFVTTQPQMLTAAASDLQAIDSVSGQAAAVHDMFVTTLAAGADSYAATETSNTIAAS
jgi:hypothetical protein